MCSQQRSIIRPTHIAYVEGLLKYRCPTSALADHFVKLTGGNQILRLAVATKPDGRVDHIGAADAACQSPSILARSLAGGIR